MYVMNEEERSERAIVKANHQRVRSAMHVAAESGGQEHRYMLLVWGYVRGFKYRRMERQHHVSQTFEHHMPDLMFLHRLIAAYMPVDVDAKTVKDWLLDPSGAIPAPSPRPHRPYLAAAE